MLCVTGYYNNPPQAGLREHYRTLSRETGARIILYNVPARTASYLEPETLIELAANENIIGLKQAVNFTAPGRHRDDTARVIRETAALDFSVLSGEDDALPALLALGGRGIISAAANIPEVAALFRQMLEANTAGNTETVTIFQTRVTPLIEAVFCRKNPIPLGTFFNSPLFLPLVSVRDTEGGEEAERRILELIPHAAPSLLKYHGG